jgi:two-component system OmpR family response regulator
VLAAALGGERNGKAAAKSKPNESEVAEAMRILIVEDTVKLARTLKRGLESEGYSVDVLYDGLAAKRRLAAARGEAADAGHPYDLILLDVMLPGVDGLTLCRELRARGAGVPVLMLTARDSTADKVTGLDSGADDYLVKPFAFAELLARMRTLLRRPRQALPSALRVGELMLEPSSRLVQRGDEPIGLSAKEFALLELFMRNAGKVLTRDHILDHAWDEEFDSFSNVVDVYIARLRKKLDRSGEPSLFQAVRGVGYVLRAEGEQAVAGGSRG